MTNPRIEQRRDQPEKAEIKRFGLKILIHQEMREKKGFNDVRDFLVKLRRRRRGRRRRDF